MTDQKMPDCTYVLECLRALAHQSDLYMIKAGLPDRDLECGIHEARTVIIARARTASNPQTERQQMTDFIDIVLDGRQQAHSLVFVEIEDDKGKSIRVGDWIERADGFHALRISTRNLWKLQEIETRVTGAQAIIDAKAASLEIDYDSAPNALGPHFRDYIERRLPLGGFLRAVLENDLKNACGRADVYNRVALVAIVEWLYNNVPANCWGSKEAVAAWLSVRS